MRTSSHARLPLVRLGVTAIAVLLLAAMLPFTTDAASVPTVNTAPAFTSDTSTTFTADVMGSFTVKTTGTPTPTIQLTGGTLPGGVTFTDNGNGTGTLAGTPAAASDGTYGLTFTASNGVLPNAVQGFTLTVAKGTAPAITSASSTIFTTGVMGTFTVTTSGVPTPKITMTGTLPGGVTFIDNGNGTGTLAGTPAAASDGTYALIFTASNGNLPNAVQGFTLTVGKGTAPTITSASSTTFTIGVSGTFTVTTTGSPPPKITLGGAALPSGVTFTDKGDGTATLAGTPASGTTGSYAITFTASNGTLPNAVQGFTLTVSPPGPSVTINQASGQADPTAASPINFTVVFASSVTGFATGDVTISGTAGGTKVATVTGSGTTYNVAVTGMTSGGTVIATVPAGVAVDSSGRPNLASTSTDNTVTWAPAGPAFTVSTSAPIPPGAQNPVIIWGQGFTLSVAFSPGTTVQLQGNRDTANANGWNTIATLTLDASGHAAYHYTPVTNLFYRAVFPGSGSLAAQTSNIVRTVVRQIGLLRPTNHGAVRSLAAGSSVTFSTTVRPSRPELTPAVVSYWFYEMVGGRWVLQSKRNVTVSAVSGNQIGVAVTTFTFGAGQWYVRSQANPTPYNANSVMSPSERYSVG